MRCMCCVDWMLQICCTCVFARVIVGIHPSIIFRTRTSAMAFLLSEAEMTPPDLEPGAMGSYKITHVCFIDGEQIFHMELSGINYSDRHAWGQPFEVSAVVHNPEGHAPDATGTYRILDKDLRTRHCILDIGNTIGARMNMKWRPDKKASDEVYEWQAWP